MFCRPVALLACPAAIAVSLVALPSSSAGWSDASMSISVLPLTITSSNPAATVLALTDFSYEVTTTLAGAGGQLSYRWDFALEPDESLELLPSGSVAAIRQENSPQDLGGMTEEELEAAETSFSAQMSSGAPAPTVSPEAEAAAAADDSYEAAPEPNVTTDPPEASTDEPTSPETYNPTSAPHPAEDGNYFDDPAYAPADSNPKDGSDSLAALSTAQETAGGEVVAVVSAPTASDATGQPVPSRLDVSGATVTLTVDSSGPVAPAPKYVYPIKARSLMTADPDLEPEIATPGDSPVRCQPNQYGRVNTWNPFGWDILVNKLSLYPASCARYYIAIPPVGPADHQCAPRPGVAAQIRALNQLPQVIRQGASFHALAEFKWADCGMDDLDNDPVAVARDFRELMASHGYDISRQETWAINELPERVRTSSFWRNRARTLIAALYDGGGGRPPAPGVVYMVWKQQATRGSDLAAYKTVMKDWTLRQQFWQSMRTPSPGERRVRLWGQEVFTDCRFVCIRATSTWANVNAKAQRVNAYIQHHARLAFAPRAPQGVRQARMFFDVAYTPVANGFWRSDVFHTQFGLDRMKRLVSLQTYAARAWSFGNRHPYPDRRIGFAWNQRVPPDLSKDETQTLRNQFGALAQRIARSIQGAYGRDGTPPRACSPGGNYPAGCNPTQRDAGFNDDWNTFSSWSRIGDPG